MRCWLNDAKSMLLLTSSTLEWKRRFDRGDGLQKVILNLIITEI